MRRVRVLSSVAAVALVGALVGPDTASAQAKPSAKSASAGAAAAPSSTGPISIEGAWIRATVKGQTATGGFMTLRSSEATTLEGFSAPGVASAQIHEMKMEGDVMRMRALQALPLPAGQSVALKPGGHHLMLMGLAAPLNAGSVLKLTLLLRTPDGKAFNQVVDVPVRAAAPGGKADGGAAAGHDHMHH